MSQEMKIFIPCRSVPIINIMKIDLSKFYGIYRSEFWFLIHTYIHLWYTLVG